jgi:hypothetical protein
MSTAQASPPPIVDEAEAALAYHSGDAAATIMIFLEDLRYLRLQLALTEGAMSRGMTRGWSPSYDRD